MWDFTAENCRRVSGDLRVVPCGILLKLWFFLPHEFPQQQRYVNLWVDTEEWT
jgi:hypothetical protein